MYIYYATIQCKLFLTRGHSQKILKATGLEVEAERLTKEEPATESQPGLLRMKRYKGARESLRRQKLKKNRERTPSIAQVKGPPQCLVLLCIPTAVLPRALAYLILPTRLGASISFQFPLSTGSILRRYSYKCPWTWVSEREGAGSNQVTGGRKGTVEPIPCGCWFTSTSGRVKPFYCNW